MNKKTNKTSLLLPIFLIIVPLIIVLLGTNMTNFTLPVMFDYHNNELQRRNAPVDSSCIGINPDTASLKESIRCFGGAVGQRKPAPLEDALYYNSSYVTIISFVIAIPSWIIGFIMLRNRLRNRKL